MRIGARLFAPSVAQCGSCLTNTSLRSVCALSTRHVRAMSAVRKRRKMVEFKIPDLPKEYNVTPLYAFESREALADRLNQIVAQEGGDSQFVDLDNKFRVLSKVYTEVDKIPNLDLGALDNMEQVLDYFWNKRVALAQEKEDQEALVLPSNLQIFTSFEDEGDDLERAKR